MRSSICVDMHPIYVQKIGEVNFYANTWLPFTEHTKQVKLFHHWLQK